MPSVIVNGARWWSDGCSPERYWSGRNGTGNEAPPEVYEAVTEKWMRRIDRKPAGRRRMPPEQTIDELRLRELESGRASEEELTRRDGLDIESLRRSIRRARSARKQSGQ
jgi:hypothetical protein